MNYKKDIILKNTKYSYTLIKSKRKSIVIRIMNSGKIEIRAPININDKYINDFINKKQDWIIKNIETVQNNEIKNKIYFLGNLYKYKFENGSDNKIIFNKEEIKIIFLDNNNPKDIMIDLFKKEFKKIIEPIISKNCKIINVYPEKINIKILKSRWGSCSSKGNLNFNLCLIGAPLSVIEYVIIHELCHMKEMNHSKKFWDLVRIYYNNYIESEQWLKRNGSNLINIFM